MTTDLFTQHGLVRDHAEWLYKEAEARKNYELAALYGRVVVLLDEACRLMLKEEKLA